MLKKILFLCAAMLFATTVIADEANRECESAVDSADRLSADPNNQCDYSKTGLNGVLHRAFSNKSDISPTKAEASSNKVGAAVSDVKNINASRVVAFEISSAQQLSNGRFELLQQALHECPKGFLLEGERYLPVAQHLMLELNFHCL